jgi:two-component system response regulator HydG
MCLAYQAGMSIEKSCEVIRGGKQVLVVDDDPCILNSVSKTLKRAGLETLIARGPRAALRMIARRETPIDLLICDLTVGQEDGMALVRCLRRRWPSLPALVLTAWGDRSLGFLIPGCEVSAILSKPLSSEELMASVRMALNHKEESR